MESGASICFYAVNFTSNKNIPIKTCKPISRSKAGEKGEFHQLSSEVILQEQGAKTGATKNQKNAHTYFTTLLCGSKALNLARRISFLFRKKFVAITVNRKPFRQCFFALEFRFGEPFEGVAKFCFDFRKKRNFRAVSQAANPLTRRRVRLSFVSLLDSRRRLSAFWEIWRYFVFVFWS